MRLPFLHPDDRALKRFADGDVSGSDSASTANHLARCPECRAHVAFMRQLGERARALATPDAPAGMLERILTERARGDRHLLPASDAVTSPPSRKWPARSTAAAVLGCAVAAAIVLILGPTRESSKRTPSTDSAGSDLASSDAASFFASVLSPAVAVAQTPPRRTKPAVPPVSGIDGSRLHAGRLVYLRRWTDSSGRVREDGRNVLRISPDSLGGTAVWRIEDTWTGESGERGQKTEVETLFVARRDMRLVQRVVHASPYSRYGQINIEQRFVGDSVRGRMTAEGGGRPRAERPIAQYLPPAFGPYVTDALGPLLLSTVDVAVGWRGSVSLAGWAVLPSDVFYPIELSVVGEDRITVPAGTFDCWRISLALSGADRTYWIRKADGRGVLVRDETQRATRGVRDVVLVDE